MLIISYAASYWKDIEVTKQRQEEDSGNLTVKEMCPVLEIAATTNAGNDICLAVFQKQYRQYFLPMLFHYKVTYPDTFSG